jgi:hypothetical protein
MSQINARMESGNEVPLLENAKLLFKQEKLRAKLFWKPNQRVYDQATCGD